MEKSQFSPLYGLLRRKLVEIRKASKLTQRDLAKRVRRERSFVAKVEQGERRVDLVEFYWLCEACGVDPAVSVNELLREFKTCGKNRQNAGKKGKR